MCGTWVVSFVSLIYQPKPGLHTARHLAFIHSPCWLALPESEIRAGMHLQCQDLGSPPLTLLRYPPPPQEAQTASAPHGASPPPRQVLGISLLFCGTETPSVLAQGWSESLYWKA